MVVTYMTWFRNPHLLKEAVLLCIWWDKLVDTRNMVKLIPSVQCTNACEEDKNKLAVQYSRHMFSGRDEI